MNGILNTVMILMRGLFFMSLDLTFDWKHYVNYDEEIFSGGDLKTDNKL